MKRGATSGMFNILQGDALAVLRTLPDESVHCCVTSPPYFGLRDYGVPGQIGLEVEYPSYIARLLEVFAEVRRVLRTDGTLWVNIGDSYATGAGKVGECPGGGEQGERWKGYRGTRGESPKHSAGAMRPAGPKDQDPKRAAPRGPMTQANRLPQPGLKPKDLMMIPARLALALQADGWYLRSDIIWSKPNPMPESVTDRPTKAHEYIFLLSKSERYRYDADAIREKQVAGWRGSTFTDERDTSLHPNAGRKPRKAMELRGAHGTMGSDGNGMRMPEKWDNPLGRNKRTVWTVSTCPTPEAHFATYPPDLIEPCILAGCPEGGTVLDPFSGAGTTGLACLKHGRQFIGIELNPEYIGIAMQRASKYYPLLVGATA